MRYVVLLKLQSRFHADHHGKLEYLEARANDVQLQNNAEQRYLPNLYRRKQVQLTAPYEQFHRHLECLDKQAKHQHRQNA